MARLCTFAVPGVFALVLAVHHAVLSLATLMKVRPQDTLQALVQIPQVQRTCMIAPWGSVIIFIKVDNVNNTFRLSCANHNVFPNLLNNT